MPRALARAAPRIGTPREKNRQRLGCQAGPAIPACSYYGVLNLGHNLGGITALEAGATTTVVV